MEAGTRYSLLLFYYRPGFLFQRLAGKFCIFTHITTH